MVNAIKVAADFISSLPGDRLSPETTEGAEGFVHPYVMDPGVDRTSVKLLIRDFDERALSDKERWLEDLARAVVARHPGGRATFSVEQSYRNMKVVLDRYPEVVAYACDAVRAAGLEVRRRSIRGGTDGSRLSFMGLPTPNLFAGEHNFHSRLEWVSVQDMEKAVEVIVHLARIWEERSS
jgi:tripeptide aminopeptidase